ncbi:tyrosine-type recombinase/integrase [Aurantibacter crassamenti]|uniref:tyrosine-type recombinase/integrase n=1 Tax=Aurantibacter crassamenti TaxID=1837375 RepID=UPI00193ADC37|nr:tyrosine-type recombinase/integrase [Aurantibacter crassamenti]MBM1107980.1 tyrosine-type recombinase/integrase [Aurantibacter crassamenti]
MSIQAFVDYLLHEKNYSLHTVTAYQKDIQAFSDFCLIKYEISNIDSVDYAIVRGWIVMLVDDEISNRTVNRKIASLKAYYKFLQRIGLIDSNPLAKHKALKTAKKIEVPFSEEEMAQVLSQIDFEDDFEGIRNKLIIELLYTTGMRRAELVGLTVENVDLKNRVLKVLGKRNKERLVPLLPNTIELFNLYLERRETLENIFDKSFIFLSKSGKKVYGTLVYRVINHYLSLVSSKVKRSPHILRHTFATHLLNKGADLNSVKELLGHSSLASTQVYTHNSIAELKKIHSMSHPRSKN